MKPNIFNQLVFVLSILCGPLAWAQQSTYCAATGTSNYYAAINSIQLAGTDVSVAQPVGSNYPGYIDSTNGPKPTLVVGSDSTLDINSGRYGSQKTYISVYIDLNHDNQFSDDERVYFVDGSTDLNFSTPLKIPESALTGDTRMRVMHSLTPIVSACGDPNNKYKYSVGNNAEVVDSTVNIKKANYCEGYFGSQYYGGISEVKYLNVDNVTTKPNQPYPSYSDYTALSATASPGDTIPISITTTAIPLATSYIKVYVDLKNNGTWTEVYSTQWTATSTHYFETVSGSFVIPPDAVSGKVGLRVVTSLSPITTACGQIGGNGEVEDYSLIINCKPPKPTTSAAFICPSTANTAVTNPTSSLNYTWYNAVSGGITLGSGTSYSTNISTTTNFFVEAKNSQGCVSDRALATVVFNQCCASNASYYTVVPAYQTFESGGNLILNITNNRTVAKNLVVILSGGFKSATSSKSISLQAGQKSSLEFIGDFPIQSGSYIQTITIQDGICTYTYTVPINVSIVTPIGALGARMVTALNLFELTNLTPSSKVDYDVIDPYGNKVSSGSVAANSTGSLDLRNSTYAIGKYQIKCYVNGASRGTTVIHKN